MSYAGWHTMRSFSRDRSITQQKIKSGTIRRIMSYARPYRRELIFFLIIVSLDAVITVAVPLLLRNLIDNGILPRDKGYVLAIGGAVVGLALFDALLSIGQRWYSARIGEGLIYDLRTEVFGHVQSQPIAFFTRAQTGSLVSRLNSDVIGAQQALTSTLSSVVANVLSLALVLIVMVSLSWLVTLFGRPAEEADVFGNRAGRVRDIGVQTAMYGSSLFIALTLLASLATAVVYGLGGFLVIDNFFKIGTLVALAALIGRLYGPITSLSNVQVDVMTALVSFDRVFEVLDLKPLIEDAPDAT